MMGDIVAQIKFEANYPKPQGNRTDPTYSTAKHRSPS